MYFDAECAFSDWGVNVLLDGNTLLIEVVGAPVPELRFPVEYKSELQLLAVIVGIEFGLLEVIDICKMNVRYKIQMR